MENLFLNINRIVLYICVFLSIVVIIELVRFIIGLKKISNKTETIKKDLDRIAVNAEEISIKEKKIENTFRKTTKSISFVSLLVLISSLLKDRNKNKNGNKGIIQEYRESNKARKIVQYASKLK